MWALKSPIFSRSRNSICRNPDTSVEPSWGRASPIKTFILCCTAVVALYYSAESFAGNPPYVQISLAPDPFPADDLIYQGRVLTHEAALRDERDHNLDLSKLQPEPTDEYLGVSTVSDATKDQALPVADGQTVQFNSVLQGAGPDQFEAVVQTGQPGAQPLILLLSANIHKFLLRKELLRRLGYKVPPMKWLRRITVHFDSPTSIFTLFDPAITSATNVSQKRWIVNVAHPQMGDQTLQDVVIMPTDPVMTRYYNLAFGPPVQPVPGSPNSFYPQDRRIMRALAIEEGLTYITQSLNMVDWNVGYVNSNVFTFALDDTANFGCGVDDAIWMARKIANLSRQDFVDMVNAADYPDSTKPLIVEKLIARRDSIMRELGLRDVAPLPFNAHITVSPYIKSGKFSQTDTPGFVTSYAGHDLASPVTGLGWYALTELEGNVLENLFTKINSDIPGLTIASQTNQHGQDVVQQAIDRYLQTGVFQTPLRKVWTAPLLNGGVAVSRSIVIGNYMGTNNLVSLADSASEYVNVGVVVGMDGLPVNIGVSGLIQGTLMRNMTHIRPIQPPATPKSPPPLKTAATTPLSRIVVDLLFHDASDIFKKVAAIKPKPGQTISAQILDNQIQKELDQLSKSLNVGDSLILTDSITGVQNLTGSYGVMGSLGPSASLTVGSNQIVLSRLYVYRLDQNTIQVYKDNGDLVGANLSFEITLGQPIGFPIIMITASKVAGSGRSKIFSVNIDPVTERNPNIYNNALALMSLLRTRSIEVLASQQKPSVITASFRDSSSNFQFFHWVHRTLQLNGDIRVKTPFDQKPVQYLALLEGSQSGKHYQQLATQVGTYITQRLTKNPNYFVDTQVTPDPGRSFLGNSKTREVTFQSEVNNYTLSSPFAQIQYRWEGWSISADALKVLVGQLAQQFHYDYPAGYNATVPSEFQFGPDFLGTATKLQLYQLVVNINLYRQALNRLETVKPKDEGAFVNSYLNYYQCADISEGQIDSNDNIKKCEAVWDFDASYSHYLTAVIDWPKPDVQIAARSLMHMASDLEQILPFDQFVNFFGGPSNVYVEGVLNGFPLGSEKLITPVTSDTLGQKTNHMYPDGILNSLENRLGLNDGELYMQWIRSFL